MAPKIAEYLAKVPDSQQYPCKRQQPGLRGSCGSQGVESSNARMADVRAMPFGSTVMGLATKIRDVIISNKAAAAAAATLLPPKRHDLVQAEEEKAVLARTTTSIVHETNNTFLVSSSTNMEESYRCDLDKVKELSSDACECGMTMLNGVPCKHLVACALYKRAATIVRYMHYMDTTAGFKELYEKIDVPKLPSALDLQKFEDRIDPNLLLPPATVPARGKRRKRRHLEAGEGGSTKKRKGTGKQKKCHACGQLGHKPYGPKCTAQRAFTSG